MTSVTKAEADRANAKEPVRGPSRLSGRAVVILCEGPTPTIEMLLLASAIEQDGRLRPVLVFRNAATYDSVSPSDLADLQVVTTYSETPPKQPKRSVFAWAARLLLTVPLASYCRTYWRYLVRLDLSEAWANEVFRRFDPIAVVVHNDRSIGFGPAFCKRARVAGRLSIAVPFAVADPEADTVPRKRDPMYRRGSRPFRLLKELIAWLRPAQFRHTSHGELLFFDPPLLVALAQKNMLLPRPWTYGGGRTDVVAVYGEAEQLRIVSAGVPAEKILVSGQVSSDYLWRRYQERDDLRRHFSRAYGLKGGRPLLICALPIVGEHNLVEWDRHLQLTEMLLAALGSVECDVLLSLHPRQNRANYVEMAARHLLPILNEPLREVLPIADIFVCYSSTIKWALQMKIPCISLEYFDLGYELFADLDGVEVVRSIDELCPTIDRLIAECSRPGEISQRLARTAQGIGRFDGRAAERIIETLLDPHVAGGRPN